MSRVSGFKLLFLFLLFFLSLFISLPRVLPLKFSLFGFSVDRQFSLPGIKFMLGSVRLENDLTLKLGLDLAGGSHLVFDADTSGLESLEKEKALMGLRGVIEKRVNLFGVSEPSVQLASFEGRDRVIVELPGIEDTNEAISIIGKTASLIFMEVKGSEEAPELVASDLTGKDLESADVIFDQTSGLPVVLLTFTKEGGEKFEALTAQNVGKPLPIILDGEIVSAPVVQEKITGGSANISGDFDVDEAKNLAIQLNAGALPLSITLVEQRVIGASLGAESVEKSLFAGSLGLAAVLFFMALVYKKFGLVADFALIFFAIITLAIYKLIPVVLTLPGIAGFILAVGMAVDSNILIFERFKEEIKQRDLVNALEVSFGRAWDSIRDANVATLITCFILANPFDWQFLHTSGPVRGFAITLAIGIAVSLFTGIVVTRNLLRAFISKAPKL